MDNEEDDNDETEVRECGRESAGRRSVLRERVAGRQSCWETECGRRSESYCCWRVAVAEGVFFVLHVYGSPTIDLTPNILVVDAEAEVLFLLLETITIR